MKNITFDESVVLREFAKIASKEGFLKSAQMTTGPLEGARQPAPAPTDQHKQLVDFINKELAGLRAMPANGPGMERIMKKLRGQTDPYLVNVLAYVKQLYTAWQSSKTGEELKQITNQDPSLKMMAHASYKMAEKEYDVMADSKILHHAHPSTAKVEGDVVENAEEQQDADLKVAQKSASYKGWTNKDTWETSLLLNSKDNFTVFALKAANLKDLGKFKKNIKALFSNVKLTKNANLQEVHLAKLINPEFVHWGQLFEHFTQKLASTKQEIKQAKGIVSELKKMAKGLYAERNYKACSLVGNTAKDITNDIRKYQEIFTSKK